MCGRRRGIARRMEMEVSVCAMYGSPPGGGSLDHSKPLPVAADRPRRGPAVPVGYGDGGPQRPAASGTTTYWRRCRSR